MTRQYHPGKMMLSEKIGVENPIRPIYNSYRMRLDSEIQARS